MKNKNKIEKIYDSIFLGGCFIIMIMIVNFLDGNSLAFQYLNKINQGSLLFILTLVGLSIGTGMFIYYIGKNTSFYKNYLIKKGE